MTITTQAFVSVNAGTAANDGTGDELRTAFIKLNSNFSNISTIGFNAANIAASGTVETSAITATIGNIATLGVTGNLTTHGAQINTGYQKYSPTANIAVTANVNVSRVIITPTSVVASYGANITLPNVTVDGTTIAISSNVAVEHLAVYGQWLSSVSPGANTAIVAGGSATYFYSSADVKWYKIG